MKSRKIYSTLIVLASLGVIAFVLSNNKQIMDEKAERSLKGVAEIPVNAINPQLTVVNHDIEITGKIVSSNEVLIVSKIGGNVLAKYKEAGEYVSNGSPIAKIEDNVIKDNLHLAELNLAKARKDVERYSSLFSADAVTKSEVENMEIIMRTTESMVIELREQLKNTLIVAQTSGILEKDYFEVGSLVNSGMLLGEIIDPNSLKVSSSITEKELVRVKKGDQAIITIDTYPDMIFHGNIDLIGSKGDESMSYTVEVVFEKDYSKILKSGMHAQIKIVNTNSNADKILTIDRQCIVGSLKSPSVYVVNDGKAHKEEIITGRVFKDRVEVIRGLSPSSTVVSNGQINITDGCAVKIF